MLYGCSFVCSSTSEKIWPLFSWESQSRELVGALFESSKNNGIGRRESKD